MTLPERFSRSFAQAFPDLVGKPVLVALSGGSDSVALLHLDPTPPRGTSPEAWWRGQRYRLLEAERERAECAATATAHTLDDQAETVLLKLLRGSGPAGVAGIRRRRGAVIRPVLDLRREELRAWLRSRGATWREDASNLAADRPRVRLRRHVLPLLTQAYPATVEQLGAFAAMLAEDETFLAGVLASSVAWPAVGHPVESGPVVALAPALRRRWVMALAARLPLAEPPSRVQLAAVDRLLRDGDPAAVDLGRRWVLRRRGRRLHLSPPPLAPFAPIAVTVPSVTVLPGGFVARVAATGGGAAHAATLSRRAEGLALAWRPTLAGERWPGYGNRSLYRALAAAGVPAEWRRAWPVLDAGGTILWVPGVGVHTEWEGCGVHDIGLELEVPW